MADKFSSYTLALLDQHRVADNATASTPQKISTAERVSAYITLSDASASTAGIEALGIEIHSQIGEILTATIPLNKIEALAELPEVARVEVALEMECQTDTTLSQTEATVMLHGLENGLPDNYNGIGVVLGIIDSGIDFNHIAFLDTAGNNRIVRVYMPNDETGQKAVVDGKTLPGSEFLPDQIPDLTTDYADGSHGNHVLGIAAGTHVNNLGGMAPGAELVVCALGSKNTDTNITNSLKYINNYAKSVGKPCVVNISIGLPKGPHDGSSTHCRTLKSMGNDMIICQSVGNLANNKRYLHHTFHGNRAQEEPISTMIIGEPTQTLRCNFDTWSRSRNKVGVRVFILDAETDSIYYQTDILNKYSYIYAKDGSENYSTYCPQLHKYFNGYIGFWTSTGNNNHYNIYCEVMLPPKNDSIPKFRLAVQFFAPEGDAYQDADTEFDSWLQTSTYNYTTYNQLNGYNWVEGNDSVCMNDNATADNIISVGYYVGRLHYTDMLGSEFSAPSDFIEQRFHSTSSYGIAPNGERYPFVSAPGYMTLSAYSSYNILSTPSRNTCQMVENPFTGRKNYWGSMSGTSMATPTVAGIVAQWLQKDSTLTINDVRNIISTTAYRDTLVRQNPLRYGHGKINALGIFPDRPTTLDKVLNTDKYAANRHYNFTDSATIMHVAADSTTLYAKSGDRWLAIKLPDIIDHDSADTTIFTPPYRPGQTIGGLKGMLRDKTNLTISTDSFPLIATPDSAVITPPTLRVLTPAEFADSLPQAMEIDTLRHAMWNAADSTLMMPIYANSLTAQGLEGTVPVDLSLLATDSVLTLTNLCTYDMLVLTQKSANGSMRVYPLQLLEETIHYEHIPGDINLNGVLNIEDITLATRALIYGPTANEKRFGDANGNGKFNVEDITAAIYAILLH